jgi:lipopolysaccharide export system permease protein
MYLKKIDRYILKNLLRFTVFYTVIPTLILWIVQSRHIFELGMGGKTSVFIILKLSSYLIPPILPHILPFAIILASMTVLIRLYNDSELSVLWASGLSPAKLIKSFLIIGFIGMIVILIINAFIAPQMSRQLKIELLNLKNDIIQTALKPGVIQNIQNGTVTVYIDKINGGSYIEGFYLQQKAQNNQIRIFTAKQALLTEIKGNFQLLLLKGRILNWHYQHNTTKSTTDTKSKTVKTDTAIGNDIYPSILEFDKFTLNISDIISNFNESQDLQFKARDYSTSDLLTAKYAKTPDEKKRFIANGHEQIITSFFPIIFISLTIIFMLRPMPPRGFPYWVILKTIAIAVLLRIASSALHNFADNNLNIIYASYILHVAIIIVIMVIIFKKRQAIQ